MEKTDGRNQGGENVLLMRCHICKQEFRDDPAELDFVRDYNSSNLVPWDRYHDLVVCNPCYDAYRYTGPHT